MSRADAAAVDGVSWAFTPEGRAAVSDVDLRLPDHLAAGRATVVKHGGHRTVYRVTLPRATVYWKVCRLYGPRAWWRDFFRGPKAKLEFDRARELAGRGIATVEPLAWGRMGGFWPPASHLITRALEDTTPLDDFLADHPPASASERRRLTTALAGYVARLHDAGVTHPDLHPGNLLVRARDGAYQFFLIDVHDIHLGPPLGREARRANLAMLNRWFQLRSTRTDRLRFLQAYGGRSAAALDARTVERETDRSIADLWASRDGRALRPNRHFRTLGGRTTSGFAVCELPPEVDVAFAGDPDAHFARPDVVLLKNSRSATVCVVPGAEPMVYKRFRVTEWTDPLANLFRSPPALRSWTAGHALLGRGLPTPRPLLVLHRRRFEVPLTGYLLCAMVSDARHLHEVPPSATRADKRDLIDRLARWVRLMHERGVSHRDLKAANILVDPKGECHFIDLVGVRIHRTVSRRLRVRDLARLNVSFLSSPAVTRTDRLRFLRVYLLWGLRGSAGWKDWWNEVAGATRAKVRKNALRNRPLG